MNNRKVQPAGSSRAAETDHIVDLTSVCVRSGSVRLPLSMMGIFAEGAHQVRGGGEEHTLRFEAPRTLTGLQAFFAASELKANDRVRFVFGPAGVEMVAVKRERSRPPAEEGQATTQAPNVAPPQPVRSSRITLESGRASSAELMNRVGAGGSAGSEATGDDGAVRRVRIEVGMTPQSSNPAPRPRDRASAHAVWSRKQSASWRALDTTIAGPVITPEEAADTFSETTVRVIRRSSGTATPLSEDIRSSEAKAKPEKKIDQVSISWPLPDRDSRTDSSRLEEDEHDWSEVAAEDRGQRVTLDPYLDAPIDADSERGYVPLGGPTILESDLLNLPTGRSRWRDESEEAYSKYQEGVEASAAREERRPGFFQRLGLAKGGRESAPVRREQETPPQPAPTSAPSRGATQQDSGDGYQALGAPGIQVPVSEPPGAMSTNISSDAAAVAVAEPVLAESNEVDGERAEASKKRVLIDDSVLGMEFPTAGEHSGERSGIEADMAALLAYFNEPEVPAIVRCDELGERLAMDTERVKAAMERLAEDRDRFTPLRGDAYMIRRPR